MDRLGLDCRLGLDQVVRSAWVGLARRGLSGGTGRIRFGLSD